MSAIAFAIMMLLIPPEEVYTPYHLAGWLSENFTYDDARAADPDYDCYALAIESFIENGMGTCKDFAYANNTFLEELGYETSYVYYYDIEQGNWHVVNEFVWNEHIYMLDGWNLSGPYQSVDDFSPYDEYVREPVDSNLCVWR